MRKNLFLLLLLTLLPLAEASAQSISKQINDIRRSDTYISAEATMETQEKALELAQELLAQQIEEYVAGQKDLKKAPNVIVKDVAAKADLLKMNRGEMVRVFLYVKKSDILAANNTQVLVQPANATKPATDEKAKTEKSKETKKSKQKETPAVEPVAMVTVEPAPQATEDTATEKAPEAAAPWQQAVINELLACADANEAQEKLGKLRAKMKVKRYGTPDTCRKPADAFWMILDADGQVQTILGPATGNNRTNFRTGDYDSLSNYKGLGAIWFTL